MRTSVPHGQNRNRSRQEPKVRIQLPPAESRTKPLGCIGLVRVTGWLGSGVAARLT